MDEQPEVIDDREQWFVVAPRVPAKLAFEEWDGRVPAVSSPTLQPIPPCVICGANHTTCES